MGAENSRQLRIEKEKPSKIGEEQAEVITLSKSLHGLHLFFFSGVTALDIQLFSSDTGAPVCRFKKFGYGVMVCPL